MSLVTWLKQNDVIDQQILTGDFFGALESIDGSIEAAPKVFIDPTFPLRQLKYLKKTLLTKLDETWQK